MASSKWQWSAERKVMAPLESVWMIASDFYGIYKWLPGIKSSERVEGTPENGVGCVRRCVTSLLLDQEGIDSFGVEELIAFDNINHSYTYRLTDNNCGFSGYEATIKVSETGEDANCLLKWSFQMEDSTAGHSKEEVEALWTSLLTGMAKNLEQLASLN